MERPPAHRIETHGLTKHFEPRVPRSRPWEIVRRRAPKVSGEPTVAVRDLNLRIPAGECYGLLGPNGAGKTTTVKMLSTLLEPTAGTALVSGFDTVRQGADVRGSIGVMFAGERGLYWRLTGRENLELFGRMEYMTGSAIRERTAHLLDHLGLADRADELVETYSTGMKQRLNLARTLLHDPPVLMLDEPTAALDPAAARGTRRLLRELRGEGKTVLLTTHSMHEAEEICDRVGIIHRGVLVAEGAPRELIREAGLEPRLELRLSGNLQAARTALGDQAIWWGDPADDGSVEAAVRAADGWRTAHALDERLRRDGVTIDDARLRDATLEDAFIKLTGARLEDPFERV